MNPEESIGFLVKRTGRVLRNMIQLRLKEAALDISMEQGAILMRVEDWNGCTQNELTSFLSKDKTTVARLVASMEKKSLLVRVPASDDARKKLLYLTQKGKDVHAQLKTEIMTGLYIASQGVSEEEMEVCKKVLNKMYDNMSSIIGEDHGICE